MHNHIYPSLSIAKTISTMPDTFHEIDHRQTIYGHLTIIDDALLQMFLKYDEIIHAYLTRDKIIEWKVSFFSNVLHKSLDELYADQHLTIPSDMSPAIFKLLAIRYLKVSMGELKFKLMTKEKIKKVQPIAKPFSWLRAMLKMVLLRRNPRLLRKYLLTLNPHHPHPRYKTQMKLTAYAVCVTFLIHPHIACSG